MCLLCVEIQKQKLTPLEIARNYGEIVEKDPDHWVDILVELEKQNLVEEVSKELSDIQKGEKR